MVDERICEERAASALERAAQLQLEAAERVERGSSAVARREGYARQELVDAATEAGIEARFVELALREQALATDEPSSDTDAALTRWLGSKRRSMSVSRVFDADLSTTVETCCMVFESEKVRLELRGEAERIEPDEGGVLEFRMPRLGIIVAATGKYTQLAYRLEQLEMWTLHATFRPIGARTEVVLVGDLRSGAHANLRVARIGGALGAAGGVAAGFAVPLSIVAIPVVVLGAAGVGLAALAYRALYRSVLRNTEAELEDVLAAVAGELSRKTIMQR